MAEPFEPSIEELNYFVTATFAIAFGFIAFNEAYSLYSVLFYILVSASILFLRELGQRIIANWMEADVELELSMEGTSITILGGIISVLTSLPGLFLFPVSSKFSVTSYEQWGKSVDAMWLKREYWLVSGGVIGMFIGWILFYLLDVPSAAEAFSFFLIFQLLPFDYSKIPTGRLDGAVILKQNGFRWVLWFAIAWISLAAVTL